MQIFDEVPINVLRVHLECLRDNTNAALETLNQLEKEKQSKHRVKGRAEDLENNLVSNLKSIHRDDDDWCNEGKEKY